MNRTEHSARSPISTSGHGATAPNLWRSQSELLEPVPGIATGGVQFACEQPEEIGRSFHEFSGAWAMDLPIQNGVFVARDTPSGDNKIAASFYDGPLWPKVKLWEKLFWLLNGGQRRAREVVLRHLPKAPGVRLLDVAIGDGVYTRWLPENWSIVGVDVSMAQLNACQRRNSDRDLTLVLGEAEDLPFDDGVFDAVLSNGGFNHFNHPEEALREMVRVARPGAPIVVADEMPDFLDIGHRLGLPGLDRWIASKVMRMGDDFAGVVDRHRDIDVAAIGRRVLKDCRFEVIWRGLGYKMVGTTP